MISIWQVTDLGTLRTVDLFVTTPDIRPIDNFQIADFIESFTPEKEELENYYNYGEITDEMAEDILANFDVPAQQSLMDSITEAFGDAQDTKKRLEGLNFSDLL